MHILSREGLNATGVVKLGVAPFARARHRGDPPRAAGLFQCRGLSLFFYEKGSRHLVLCLLENLKLVFQRF